jgi:hypothetical protein
MKVTRLHLQIAMFSLFLFTASIGFARDYIIYSISQEIPMGEDNEVLKKNYYINMGTQQGVEVGNVLNVFRSISRQDPYESKTRYNYTVKVGELKVLHAEDNTAIGKLQSLRNGEDTPLFEINNFMIGDKVDVRVK